MSTRTARRAQEKLELKHVLTVVLDLDDDAPLVQAMEQLYITRIQDLICYPEDDITKLSYQNSTTNKDTFVPAHQKQHIRMLKAFQHYNADNNTPIQDWNAVTMEDYENFRANPAATNYLSGPSVAPAYRKNTPTTTNSTKSSSYSSSSDPISSFKKGIKRDPSNFPELVQDKQWDNFHRSMTAEAYAQDVADILDPAYIPPDDTAKELFTLKQRYMYAVFVRNLKNDLGKGIVRQYEDTFDAQAVYSKLLTHYKDSTKSSLDASNLLTYITTARLGSAGSWKGSTSNFLIHWTDQIRQYHTLVPSTDRFSDQQLLTMLQNAVHPITELRQVKNQADQMKAQFGNAITYAQYVKLLESSCIQYDSQFSESRKLGNTKRAIYNHEFEYEDDNGDPYDDAYGIDVDSYTILANATMRPPPNRTPSRDTKRDTSRSSYSNNGTRMGKDKWTKLAPDMRSLWDKLDDESKRIILGTDKRTINIHDLSASELLALQAHKHELNTPDSDSTTPTDTEPVSHEDAHETVDDNEILVNAAKTNNVHPGDIRRVLGDSQGRTKSVKFTNKNHFITYTVSASKTRKSKQSLVDRGANGGVAGEDVRLVPNGFTHRYADIEGIDNHRITHKQIGTFGGVTETQYGPVILIFNEYAYNGQGPTIHAPTQFEHYGLDVNDKSVKVGGLQRITTPDGYCLPLDMVHGLPRLKLRPYTDEEWDSLPMVIMTSDNVWDPTQLDHTYDDVEEWYDAVTKLEDNELYNLFDEYGNYRHRTEVQTHEHATDTDELTHDDIDDAVHRCICNIHQLAVSTSKRDYEKLRPIFGWLSTLIIEKTFELSTQYGKLPNSTILKKHYKSPNPALNVQRRDEPLATDTIFSDTPAIDNGSTVAQFFVGTKTRVCDVYSMKTSKQFVNTLEDIIIARGAPTRLLSDSATLEISERVKDILRTMLIGNWQSEPYQQHQNPAERRYQTVKNLANVILDRTSAPPHVWFLCLEYVCFLLNHTYCQSIKAIPMQCLTGSTPDISPLLRFYFWQPVLYMVDDSHFPSESREERGHFVGIAENVGHSMTFKILSDKTQKVICRSNIRPVTDADPNIRSSLLHGEEFTDSTTIKISNPIIKSKGDTIQKINQKQTEMGSTEMGSQGSTEKNKNSIPVFSPSDLVGRTFLMDEQEDGQRLRARIIEALEDHETAVEQNPTKIRFRCSLEGGNLDAMEELIAYNEVVDYITRDEETDIVWKFKRIVAHEGPLNKNDHSYKGSKYNVMIEWENGEKTSEPLSIIAKDDPVTCAIYAREHDLLNMDGWKQFKKIAKRKKTFDRQVKQAKLRSFRRTPKYMFGYQIPYDYKEAINLDNRNGNKRWEHATTGEMGVMGEYEVFKDHGHKDKVKPPDGYKKIRVHLVFAVKHDGRHKARLVADGHLTDVPTESVYSGVVSLRGLRLVIFLGELNNLEVWAGDIGSAYLEAKTREKLYIIAGPEFKELENHILLIYKALYGLRTSGARWHDRFADCMRDMGFFPSKAEPDIWMRAREDSYYEYIAVYVDDLAIAAKDPASIIKELRTKHKFKIKGDGPITYHLGMDFDRDEHGIMCIKPKKYIDKMIETYTRTFGKAPEQNVTSPLAKNDHPELDTSDLLEGDDIVKYQSCIGALQWLISIGRFDIAVAVMTLSSFRAAPRKGHLDRIKRIYGYVAKMKHACIRVRTAEPDYSGLPVQEFDWAQSVYGDTREILPKDAPKPLGKWVTSTHYVDANLMHCMLTGKSVTAILHILNQTPMDWHTKKQATVETATYGSEFVAARTCVEQIIELRTQLRYLGVPIREVCYMFGDNKSVVDSATIPHAKLHKRHTMLSFHRVREAIASKYIRFYHIDGENNPADILSKHWGYAQIWPMLRTLLFYKGNTEDLIT